VGVTLPSKVQMRSRAIRGVPDRHVTAVIANRTSKSVSVFRNMVAFATGGSARPLPALEPRAAHPGISGPSDPAPTRMDARPGCTRSDVTNFTGHSTGASAPQRAAVNPARPADSTLLLLEMSRADRTTGTFANPSTVFCPGGTQGIAAIEVGVTRPRVVLAGPGSSITIPGIVASEIGLALARSSSVTRIEVDLGAHATVGLHRAPSLAAAHGAADGERIVTHRAPTNARSRAKAFRSWIGPEVHTAVAYAWPGIDNGWIEQYLQVSRATGVSTVVACASLPEFSRSRIVKLADILGQADLVLVGDMSDATELMASFGPSGPVVETHRALSLGSRDERLPVKQITAFLGQDDVGTLSTVLAAFDAIPEAWIHDFQLRVVSRCGGPEMPGMIAGSHYANSVELIGQELSAVDLELLCLTSSALCVVDPIFESRALSAAMSSGVATVVLAGPHLPEAGGSYVGGLLADRHRPASVHVALAHALRLSELGFPAPEAWDELAQRLCRTPSSDTGSTRYFQPQIRAG